MEGEPKISTRERCQLPREPHGQRLDHICMTRDGKKSILLRLNLSPEQRLKVCRILWRTPSSASTGLTKIPASSAYKEQLRVAGRGKICERIPDWIARSIIL
jgi:hypothetical protein